MANILYFCGINKKSMIKNMQPFAAKPWEQIDGDTVLESTFNYCIIIWNDDVNTFEWVIETLIEVCGHSPEQAEQCALLIHHKGKYAVKEGGYEILKPLCTAITDRGISATIEQNVRS